MRTRIKQFFLLGFLPLLISSCSSLEQITIGEIKNFEFVGINNNILEVKVGIPVDNPSIYPLTITHLDLRTSLNGRYIGKIILDEPVKFKSRTNQVYDLPVKVQLSNIFVTAFIMVNLKQGAVNKVKFEGTGNGKSLLIPKEIPINHEIEIKM